ncbi:uncharacterized protein LOC128178200 [Crassostrea angulata]|uniref:uncharacterized protein LOC128178200 n=1 Tax=Magallana angulata TaxID=2784310 RepID=UPI0022B11ED0|nr:uncharacterized protein LOC128178200 [Crassostrea angulata]
MLRQDVFFAERNFSENYCIENMPPYERLQKATEMNSYSSKRKRMDEQCLATEAASIIYKRPEMGFLTTPLTSGTLTEANQVLSVEQIQQFISSTALARHRTITKPSNVCCQSESRPTLQNFQTHGTQEIISLSRTATQRIIVPQIQGSLSLQTVTPQVPREQPQHYAQRAMFYGHTQSTLNTESYNSIQNGQFRPYAVIASDRICPKNKKNTERRRKNNKSKAKEAPQGSSTSPNVDKQQQSTNIGIATTNHLTAGDHSQNSPTNQPEPWSLVPQPVLMHVKPMEAQTNQTLSRLMALRAAERVGGVNHFENSGYKNVVAKRKLETEESDSGGRTKKKMRGQNHGHATEQLSTKQNGGKKTVKRIIIPPKTRKTHVSPPPYVSRIMRILARGKQTQSDTFDDNEHTNEKLTQKGSAELRAESTSKEIKPEAITSRTVDNKKFSKDLSCDALLNTDNFFGPEMFVTSGDLCLEGPSLFL